MSKGIIVVDIQEYCDYCPAGRIFGIESGVECLLAPKGHAVSGYGYHVDKPDWCPIRPVPEEINRASLGDMGYKRGWNACLEEILGNAKR